MNVDQRVGASVSGVITTSLSQNTFLYWGLSRAHRQRQGPHIVNNVADIITVCRQVLSCNITNRLGSLTDTLLDDTIMGNRCKKSRALNNVVRLDSVTKKVGHSSTIATPATPTKLAVA